jgi:IclR family transcriptional regulator, KDG regulon repressor
LSKVLSISETGHILNRTLFDNQAAPVIQYDVHVPVDRSCYNKLMQKQEKTTEQREFTKFSNNSTNEPAGSPSLLEKVTNILNFLGNGLNSTTEIATHCGYSISTVQRLLQNLSALGWVVQDETNHKYFLGPLVHELAAKTTSAHQFLILHALKEMDSLAGLTRESVVLGALEQMRIVLLHNIQSPHNLRVIEAERPREMYVGATAKILLSQLDDRELKNFFKHVKIKAVTSESITNTATIFQQIREIRQKGFSVSHGERIQGVLCIAAPVKNYFCPAALYIIAPEDRLKPKLDISINALVNSARNISESIAGAFNG